ncbi:hypothetical protein ETB97_006408 [Aspergillus alliaceus]|uniref:Uncharacterized protein n=1 Tax=Petromyces alliaceus TaxID=209559 RepID=A0A8H5ZWI2_PETAA|nr:hypothetical protein ETB97_006408 [Aspergillus burnettii]
MEPNQRTDGPPPPYEEIGNKRQDDILNPAVLTLANQSIHAETTPSTPLYRISQDITSTHQKFSSLKFERIETPLSLQPDSKSSPEAQHLFFLAHPAHAQYRTDIPAYYITSVSSKTLGNIRFEMTKSRLQKIEFRALLSAKKTACDKPLFDEGIEEPLFSAKPKWSGSRYRWLVAGGNEVAFEDGKGERQKLVVTVPLQRDKRDALVALWILRLWHDTAESRLARREALEALTPHTAYAGMDLKFAKRAGALGALGGGGA